MCSPLPDLLALFCSEVFLFVLVEHEQQMNVLPHLQVQVQITVAAAFSLAAAGVCQARLADATQARNHPAAIRFAPVFTLNCSEHSVGATAGKAMKFPREGQGFDELHIVIVLHCGM